MSPRATQDRHPWPDIPTSVQPYTVSLDGGGRHLVDARIEKDAVGKMLERGCFLGGSTHRWLACSPYHKVIAVDFALAKTQGLPLPGEFFGASQGKYLRVAFASADQ